MNINDLKILIGANKTEEALKLLLSSDFIKDDEKLNSLYIISGTLNKLKLESNSGTLDTNTYNLEKNKINKAILDIIDEFQKTTEQLISNTPINKIIQLKTDLSRLPIPNLNKLFGRDDDVLKVNTLLTNDNVSIIAIVGFGGIGKTSFVDYLLNSLAPIYNSSKAVFAWHFYSQEMQNESVATSSLFFEKALEFYGEMNIPRHDNEKAQKLIEYVEVNKSLLILDGIEPLQYSPHINHGFFLDRAMQLFLSTIARNGLKNGGKILVTSKQPLEELKRFVHYNELTLDNISVNSGVELLKHLGVHGHSFELEKVVKLYNCHALSLVLLGRLLESDYNGDILCHDKINLFDGDESENLMQIFHYYDKAWEDNSGEKIFLYLLSLFNRPMRDKELNTLINSVAIAKSLKEIPENKFNRTIGHLIKYGLVSKEKQEYDTHSLIRNYFAKKFETDNPTDFEEAQTCLYYYFSKLPNKNFPDTLEEMEPLYRAVYHGCKAKLYKESLEIFWKRISRERVFYSQKQLGALSSDLYAISQFFPNGWNYPVSKGLSINEQAWLLAKISFSLMSLGRLQEAIEPRLKEIEIYRSLNDTINLARDNRNLVELFSIQARFREALSAAQEAVNSVNSISGDKELMMSCYARLGRAQHLLGNYEDSLNVFIEAEKRYGSMLTTTSGFYFSLLLLDMEKNKIEQLFNRAENLLNRAVEEKELLSIGNSYIFYGEVYFKTSNFQQAIESYNMGISLLEESSRIDKLPLGLSMRSNFYINMFKKTSDIRYINLANKDISQIKDILEMSPMAIYSYEVRFLENRIKIETKDNNEDNEELNKLIKELKSIKYINLLNKISQLIKQHTNGNGTT